jgi:hypothetical protein
MSIQILAYADDIDTVGWTVSYIKEAFLALSAAVKTMKSNRRENKVYASNQNI